MALSQIVFPAALTAIAILVVALWIASTRRISLESQLRAARDALGERDKWIAARDGDLAGLRSELDTKIDALGRREQALADADRERGMAQKEVAALTEARDRLQEGLVKAQARLEALSEATAKDAERVEVLKAQMQVVFAGAASTILEERSERFNQNVEQKREELNALLGPLRNELESVREQYQDLETKRQVAATELKTTIDLVIRRVDSLDSAATALSTTLTGSSQARGRWGELHLHNLLERAGMSPYCDWDTQRYFSDLERAGRPDVVIRIPHVDLIVPVDSKAPDADYRSYLDATDDAARRAALAAHVRAIDGHAKELGDREYGRYQGVAPMTIMYLANEGMLAAALAADADLWDRCVRRNVYLASPLVLLIQLRAYAEGWARYEQERNAKQIVEQCDELYRRLRRFADHFSDVGANLNRAVIAYNRAAGSYRARLVPRARMLRELGVPVTEADRERVEQGVESLAVIAGELPAPSPDEQLALGVNGVSPFRADDP